MTKNNFKELEKQELEKLEFDAKSVEKNINSSMSAIRFITDIIELYVPKVVDTVVQIIGNNPADNVKNQDIK